MNPLRVLIVDDESLARRGLEIRLREFDAVTIVGQCHNGREAIEAVRRLRPDVMFLDIQMPGIDGFAVLRELAGTVMPFTVFVTAYDEFAVQAFQANALDYLLKPINDDRLREAIQKAREAVGRKLALSHRDRLLSLVASMQGEQLSLDEALRINTQAQGFTRRLAIRDGGSTVCVNVEDIDWIDAARDYMCIHAAGKTHVLRGTMKTLEEKLDPSRFVRIHRSTIVNRNRVARLKPHRNGEYFVVLDCQQQLKLSRKYKSNIDRIAERL